MRWNLDSIAQVLVLADGDFSSLDCRIYGIATDSRADCAGKLFVALKGERFDAHDHLEEACARGAAALLVSREVALPGRTLPILRVADTRLALGQLAAAWRARFEIPVIAVTGSNGKTTTREMIAAILRAAHGAAAILSPRDNFNNEIGVPRTLLELDATHVAAVIELGMNHPGEIARLVQIVRPTAALVTNAQRAHLEGMGDLEGVAREKGSLYAGLDETGIALVNDDDPYAPAWRAALRNKQIPEKKSPSARRRVVGFSLRENGAGDGKGEMLFGAARLHGLETRLEIDFPSGALEIPLAVPGVHNARNALAAAAATWAIGIAPETIAQGLAAFPGVRGRLQRFAGPRESILLDDTYNANPDSVRAGIDVLSACVGRKFLVLGDMGEIGEASAQCHDEIGGFAKSMGIDRLYTLGEASRQAARNFGEGGQSFPTPEALVAALKEGLAPGDVVLVKGSRFMKMERVVAGLAPEQGRED
jgi:UDP-N-acetylmuramoyl-tripeptide--D-alanyl-D-alanine ligase